MIAYSPVALNVSLPKLLRTRAAAVAWESTSFRATTNGSTLESCVVAALCNDEQTDEAVRLFVAALKRHASAPDVTRLGARFHVASVAEMSIVDRNASAKPCGGLASAFFGG